MKAGAVPVAAPQLAGSLATVREGITALRTGRICRLATYRTRIRDAFRFGSGEEQAIIAVRRDINN